MVMVKPQAKLVPCRELIIGHRLIDVVIATKPITSYHLPGIIGGGVSHDYTPRDPARDNV
jgi:hypothetical protein